MNVKARVGDIYWNATLGFEDPAALKRNFAEECHKQGREIPVQGQGLWPYWVVLRETEDTFLLAPVVMTEQYEKIKPLITEEHVPIPSWTEYNEVIVLGGKTIWRSRKSVETTRAPREHLTPKEVTKVNQRIAALVRQ